MRLSNVLRKVSSFLGKAQAPSAADAQKLGKAVERAAKFVDGFDRTRRSAPAGMTERTPEHTASDSAYVKSLYKELLNREPDLDGFAAHMHGLAHGTTRDQLRQGFLDSPEYKELQNRPPPPVEPPPTQPPPSQPPPVTRPPEPGPALSTVPFRPEFVNAPIDKSSVGAAIKSAAQWVKDYYPGLFGENSADRQVQYEIMTRVIGALRTHGFDAHRVVNHPSRAVGDGWRYGSDALVIDNRLFDVYRAIGDPVNGNAPQVLEHGPYGNRPRE